MQKFDGSDFVWLEKSRNITEAYYYYLHYNSRATTLKTPACTTKLTEYEDLERNEVCQLTLLCTVPRTLILELLITCPDYTKKQCCLVYQERKAFIDLKSCMYMQYTTLLFTIHQIVSSYKIFGSTLVLIQNQTYLGSYEL